MINLTLLAYVDEDPSATLFAPEPYDLLPESAPAAVVVGANLPDCSRLCGSYSSA